ncbi:secondary thiamine-phosphate synthase enzyme YjbQ [Spartinivicinus ruber]|uniref:secondary thiamine-phosphate synthase enzyme YjbQ n=1 Tax=Spartinivicinus ruber TaxID=2683272 RepID=UPI0013D58B9F|nr:secondary thiamine-phosphate synthase enzyme YjbQ [Spartinivicinus ruber]
MSWLQKTIQLTPKPRGFHLITEELVKKLTELDEFQVGLAHFFILHTSASLTINENADPTVRSDFEAHFNHFVPEDASYYQHTYEGSDDMPAHLKTSTLGVGISVPVSSGQLVLGTWQGIYIGEHRNHGGSRRIVVTIQGERF